MVAIGVLATALALGLFSPNRVGAEVSVEDAAGTATGVTASPATPGATATYTILFKHEVQLNNGGTITVVFDKGISVPTTIDKNTILITTGQTTGGSSNPVIDPAVSTNALGNTEVVLTIGDTEPADATADPMRPQAGFLTGTDTPHKISFSPLAGIKNPTSSSAGNANDVGQAWVSVLNSNEASVADQVNSPDTTGTFTNVLAIGSTVTRSPTSGTFGTTVTIAGKGFTSGLSATIWLEVAGTGTTGVLDGVEQIIASGVPISVGEFSTTVVTDARWIIGTNKSPNVGAYDGTGATATTGIASGTFTTLGKVTTNKTSVTRGESITVSLFQFTAASVISTVTFGGVPATLPSGRTASSSGYLALSLTVPTSAPLGTQRIAVNSPDENAVFTRNTTIDIVGAPLTLTPSTAVPDQKITISGSGFTVGGSATVAEDAISTGAQTDGDAHAEVTIDNSGNLVTTYEVPSTSTLTTAGSYTVLVVDSSGRTGSATLTIPSRTLALDPESSRRGSSVSFSGAGYPASATVSIAYAGTTVATVNATSVGDVSGSFTVPTSAAIPSTNAVLASSTTEGSASATKSVNHKVPGASISVDPSSGTSGSTAIITGTGFPGYTSMSVLTLGGVSALPVPNPSSDGDGNFTATFLIPQLSVGSKALIGTIGSGTSGVTANTSFTLLATAVTPTVTTQDTTVVFADEIASDNLVRVWLFSNTTKEWTFFDPRPAFAAANDMTSSSSGDIVWVNLTADTTFQGTDLTAGWSVISLD